MRKIVLIVLTLPVFLFGIHPVAYADPAGISFLSLNCQDEYVLIRNDGETAVSLKGWVLHDHDYGKSRIYSYTFGDTVLEPGEVLQLQSGSGDRFEPPEAYRQPGTAYYIRWSDRNVWNNNCDIAYLEDEAGTPVAEIRDGTDYKAGKSDCR